MFICDGLDLKGMRFLHAKCKLNLYHFFTVYFYMKKETVQRATKLQSLTLSLIIMQNLHQECLYQLITV